MPVFRKLHMGYLLPITPIEYHYLDAINADITISEPNTYCSEDAWWHFTALVER